MKRTTAALLGTVLLWGAIAKSVDAHVVRFGSADTRTASS